MPLIAIDCLPHQVLPGALLKQLRREQAVDGGTRAEVHASAHHGAMVHARAHYGAMPVPQVLVATGAKVQYVVEGATLPDGTLVRGWMAAAPKGDVIASDDH